MREGRDSDTVVNSRLRSVLAVDDARTVPEGDHPGGSPWALPPGAAAGPRSDGWPAPDGPPLSWSDVIPGWPDDVDLGPAEPETEQRAPSASRAASAPPEAVAEQPGYRPAWSAGTSAHPTLPPVDLSPPDTGETDDPDAARAGAGLACPAGGALESRAFEGGLRSRLGAFDPGRRGVRALAAVAFLVVLVAAVLAWRARPRVEPVVPPPVGTVAADTSPAGDAPVAAGASESSAPAAVVVAVGGKVRKPGLVQLPPGARVADALRAAGGADPGVDVAPLNLARKVTDGELIMVGVTPPPGAAPTAAAPGSASGAGPVNLNTATLADLDTLPGVGPVLAQRILDAREAQGGFQAVADLRKVEGIGATRYEQLKDLVTV